MCAVEGLNCLAVEVKDRLIMNIGYYTSIDGWGGSEMYLLAMIKSIRGAGHIPVLFGIEGTRLFNEARETGIQCVAWGKAKVSNKETSEGDPLIQENGESNQATGVEQGGLLKKCLRAMLPQGLALLLGNVRELLFLRRLFLQHPVDVMHVNINGYEIAGLACRFCGIPTYGRHCIMPVRDDYYLRRWLIFWTNKYYTLTGGPSKACVEAWRRWCNFPAAQCRPVWNGIDLGRFNKEVTRVRSSQDPFRILAVGRLHPMKGFDILIRAFGIVADPRAHLIIAGEGSSEEELKRLAAEQSCACSIEFAGHREDTETLYAQAHCLVLPSVSHESFGFVLAEAMASGLPLITSDFGPFAEINRHEETGLVVPAGNPQPLADALRRLMNSPELCQQMGANAKRRAEECFSRDRMVREMLKNYEELKTCGKRV